MEGLPFDRPPDPVEAEAQDFSFNGQRNAADGANPLFPGLQCFRGRLGSPHDIHEIPSQVEGVKVKVETFPGSFRCPLHPGYGNGGAVSGQNGFLGRIRINLFKNRKL